jgi:hypothetical protein
VSSRHGMVFAFEVDLVDFAGVILYLQINLALVIKRIATALTAMVGSDCQA